MLDSALEGSLFSTVIFQGGSGDASVASAANLLSGASASAVSLAGLPKVEGSLAGALSNMANITSVGLASGASVSFGEGFDASGVTSVSRMLEGSAVRTVTLPGVFARVGADVSAYGFARDCGSLTTVDLSLGSVEDPWTTSDGAQLTMEALAAAKAPSFSDMRYAFAGCPALETLDLTGVGTWNVTGAYDGYGERQSGMHGMLAPTAAHPLEGGHADASGNLEGGGPSNYVSVTPTGAAAEAQSGKAFSMKLGQGVRKVYEGVFATQSTASSEPECVMAATSVTSVEGGPDSGDALAYRPDVYANGRICTYRGTISVIDLAAFNSVATAWDPRRYSDLLDMSQIEAFGTVGAEEFGQIVSAGFVGDADDGSASAAVPEGGQTVVWVIRRQVGADSGTLLIYPNPAAAPATPTAKTYQMRDLSDVPAPWSSLGDANGVKVNATYSQAKVLELDGLRVKAPTSVRSMFEGASAAESIDLTNMDWRQVTDMGRLFYGCASLVSVQDAPVSTVTGAATTPTEGVTIRQGGTFVRAPEA
ncbi:hypothetical protein, partial [uncultured Adlercreutzia sp.]|uniref:hypothetical protein n=1 Tax=uncultured Adlercreutzia sp. TaxID=875803 RepID=UPI00262A68C9